ncbi:MAG: diaminopimelate epimerase [Muribaculaceae bacterium]|nr:diaminopimelate epimerase [Muribaculaceae bacterium]
MKSIPFTKMHGAGNDYIYIDALSEVPDNLPLLSQEISNRHFGIGSDGLVAILPSDKADFRMRMFNADGSEAEMCGNASRCIGKYVYDKHLTDKEVVSLETLAGIKYLHLNLEAGKVKTVTVDMGSPELVPERIPVHSASKEAKISEKEIINGIEYKITAVGMGNPHAVVFVPALFDRLVHGEGPIMEVAEIFPNRANIEFIKVIDRTHIEMRVWERGSGETLACGTGACAAVVACVLNDLTDREVEVSLPGGKLTIRWDEENNHVFLTGGAEFICDGIYYFKDKVNSEENLSTPTSGQE